MARFPFSWQHTHVNLFSLLSSCTGGEISVCVFIFIPLNTKIKPPLYKTNAEWEESVWQMENVASYIKSYPTFGIQL